MTLLRYSAIRTRQTPDSEWLISLSAPATDIERWAGIPQKQQKGGEETMGFQRDENETRIAALKEFYNDPKNIIQNPLLCAIRDSSATQVIFRKTAEGDSPLVEVGHLEIKVEDLDSLPLQELMNRVKLSLEARIPGLADQTADAVLVSDLKCKANLQGLGGFTFSSADDISPTNEETAEEEEDESATSPLFEDESHVYDFWQQLAARIQILDEAGPALRGTDSFLGFTREAITAFLKPVVLVDGQHRLRGAVLAAQESAVSDDVAKTQIERRILAKEDPEVVQREVERCVARRLPVSLLTTSDPAEHVFQFVVVNQKASPIGRAMLGTIISTTLTNEELDRVSTRLENAGIPLTKSRAVAFLARNSASPFCGLVEQGLPDEAADKLPWSVMQSLVAIFQQLKGGKLFNSKVDHASVWRRKHLSNSGIVANFAEHDAEDEIDYWSQPDGPWRDVFMKFWASIRDRFGNKDDKEAKNYWGHPRTSQLFNKISLTILAADFFQYMNNRDITLESADQVATCVDEWLKGVSANYFSRAWDIAGVKKDNPGIRKQWAKLWVEYRQDATPQNLPKPSDYRKIMP